LKSPEQPETPATTAATCARMLGRRDMRSSPAITDADELSHDPAARSASSLCHGRKSRPATAAAFARGGCAEVRSPLACRSWIGRYIEQAASCACPCGWQSWRCWPSPCSREVRVLGLAIFSAT
jgi:hypothetical protein